MRRILLTVAVALLLVPLCSTVALAAGGSNPFGNVSNGNGIQDIGTWYAQDATDPNATVNVFRPELNPLSQTSTPEALNFACNYPKGFMNNSALAGRPIDSQTLQMFSDLVSIGRETYAQPDQDHSHGLFSWNTDPSNGGHDYVTNLPAAEQKEIGSGSDEPAGWDAHPDLALQAFMTYWHTVIMAAQPDPKTGNLPQGIADLNYKYDPTANSPDQQFTIGSTDQQLQSDVGSPAPNQTDAAKYAVSLLPFFDQGATQYSGISGATAGQPTNNPLMLTTLVPFGCDLAIRVQLKDSVSGLKGLIEHTGDFITNMFFDFIGKPVEGLYGVISPLAFKWAFWTPHTERGDTIFSANFDCQKGSTSSWCNPATGTANGFDSSANNQGQTKVSKAPVWVRYSIIAQWLISGLYFIVLFGGAVVYMFRGHKMTTYNVIHMLPRLLLSVILTAFSTYLIGALVTISNDLVMSLFQSEAAQQSIRTLNEMTSSTSGLTGGTITGRAIALIMSIAGVWFLGWILVLSLARQLILILLVLLAPVALFTLIVPRWQHRFKQFFRLLLAIVMVPPIIGLVLKLGVSVINSLVSTQVATQGQLSTGRALLAAVIALFTFWAMGRVMRVWFAVVRGQSWSEGMVGSGMMAMVGSRLGEHSKIGSFMMRGAQASDMLGGQAARLIPRAKEVAPGTAGSVSARNRRRHYVDPNYQSLTRRAGFALQTASVGAATTIEDSRKSLDKMGRRGGAKHAARSAYVQDPVGVLQGGAAATAPRWLMNLASGGARVSSQMLAQKAAQHRMQFPKGPVPSFGTPGLLDGAFYRTISRQEADNFRKQRDQFWKHEGEAYEDDGSGGKRLDEREWQVFHDYQHLKGVLQMDSITGQGRLLVPQRAMGINQLDKMRQSYISERQQVMSEAVTAALDAIRAGNAPDSAKVRGIIESQIVRGFERGRINASQSPLESNAYLDSLLWDLRGNHERQEELVMEAYQRAVRASRAQQGTSGGRSGTSAPQGSRIS